VCIHDINKTAKINNYIFLKNEYQFCIYKKFFLCLQSSESVQLLCTINTNIHTKFDTRQSGKILFWSPNMIRQISICTLTSIRSHSAPQLKRTLLFSFDLSVWNKLEECLDSERFECMEHKLLFRKMFFNRSLKMFFNRSLKMFFIKKHFI